MIQWWQILLLTLYSVCKSVMVDNRFILQVSPVFAGFITGLIMISDNWFCLWWQLAVVRSQGWYTFGGAYSYRPQLLVQFLGSAFSISQVVIQTLRYVIPAVPVAALLTCWCGRMTTTLCTILMLRSNALTTKVSGVTTYQCASMGSFIALPVFSSLLLGGAFITISSRPC